MNPKAMPDSKDAPKQRWKRFLLPAGGLVFFGIVLWLLAEAFLFGPARLILVRETVRIPNLPQEWNGLKILLMSDFHASNHKEDRNLIQRAVDLARRGNPDLILLLGDFLNGRRESDAMPMEEFFPMLRHLHARYGVYAVLGNHDRWINSPKIIRHLNEAGIRVLENSAVTLERDGKRLHLAGLAESEPRTDLRFVRRTPEEPLIVMMHYPDLYLRIAPGPILLLAGHTHGGQVKLPLLGRPGIPSRHGQRFAYGFIEEIPGKKMFVTSGLGTSMLRVRFRCPPEIVLLTLVRETSSPRPEELRKPLIP